MTTPVVIGIDVGTTKSCVAVIKNNEVTIISNRSGEGVVPSYVAFDDEKRIIGTQAKLTSETDPENVIYGVKRFIGLKYDNPSLQNDIKFMPYKITNVDSNPMIEITADNDDKLFRPEVISGMIIEHMKHVAEEHLNVKIRDAVITIPARFTNSQKKATMDAAKIAGLNVKKLLVETTAAAMAYGFKESCDLKKTVLVFDFGGGALDVSVSVVETDKIEVIATAGDNHLGGEDFDSRLLTYCVEEFEKINKTEANFSIKSFHRLRMKCEEAKRVLSHHESAIIEVDHFHESLNLHLTVTREVFESLSLDLFEKAMSHVTSILEDSKIKSEDIDEILLVGGSSRIPKMREMLQELFSDKRLNDTLNPIQAIAYGAAIEAGEGLNTKGIFEASDVIPYSIGIASHTGDFLRSIGKNTHYPCIYRTLVTTWMDNQTTLTFDIFEGEKPLADENLKLGRFELTELTKRPASKVLIEVEYNVDKNGLLQITAAERDKKRKNFEFSGLGFNNDLGMSLTEILDAIQVLEKFRERDRMAAEFSAAKIELEAFLMGVKIRLNNFKGSLEDEDKQDIREYCESALEWMEIYDSATVKDYKTKLIEAEMMCEVLID